MRVMLDTNILVSAFVFQSGKIYYMIDYIVSYHELVLSTYVVEELRDVVDVKFPGMAGELDEFLTTLSFSLAYTPKNTPPGLFQIRDKCDYPVLYTAMLENVDILITGDKDFIGVEVEKPEIMTVTEFIAEYME
ncbi:MAG: putative toxin-antitoxin system toxin component, PIN family [Firmicutes bacterium]|nr:putative toxin-antitoxin system toxin component, PIN family [Bacillota bacterium]